jgi:hypothetical protein
VHEVVELVDEYEDIHVRSLASGSSPDGGEVLHRPC